MNLVTKLKQLTFNNRMKTVYATLLTFVCVTTLGATPNDPPKYVARATTLNPTFSQSPVEPVIKQEVVNVVPEETVDSAPVTTPNTESGLTGSVGYAQAWGNCVNQPGINKSSGNPISWAATSSTPWIGATALWTYNHTGVVVGIWSNGDLEIAHQNYQGGQHRFPISSFRGFR